MKIKNYCVCKILDFLLKRELCKTHTLNKSDDAHIITTDNVTLEENADALNELKITLADKTWHFNCLEHDVHAFDIAGQNYDKNRARIQNESDKNTRRVNRLDEFAANQVFTKSEVLKIAGLLSQEFKYADFLSCHTTTDGKYCMTNNLMLSLDLSEMGFSNLCMHSKDKSGNDKSIKLNFDKLAVKILLLRLSDYADIQCFKRKQRQKLTKCRLWLMRKALDNIK